MVWVVLSVTYIFFNPIIASSFSQLFKAFKSLLDRFDRCILKPQLFTSLLHFYSTVGYWVENATMSSSKFAANFRVGDRIFDIYPTAKTDMSKVRFYQRVAPISLKKLCCNLFWAFPFFLLIVFILRKTYTKNSISVKLIN